MRDDYILFSDPVTDANHTQAGSLALGGMPLLNNPGATTQADAVGDSFINGQEFDPEVDRYTGMSKNPELVMLRNQQSYVPIDPFLTVSKQN